MKIRILVADDEQLERRALAVIVSSLAGEELELVEAANGRQAVELAGSVPVDIALLDIRMPGMDGLQAAHALRALNPGVHIVFVTAFDQFGYAREAIRIGVDEYLVKPSSADQVRETLQRLIATVKEERERRVSSDRAASEKERTLALLENELRSALTRGDVDGDLLNSFLTLKGFPEDSRWTLSVRTQGEPREAALGAAVARRLAAFMEKRLRARGWYLLSGAGDGIVHAALAAPEPPSGASAAAPQGVLQELVELCVAELGTRVRIGAAPCAPAEGPHLFSVAQDALALARLDTPVVLLEKTSLDLDGAGVPLVERAIDYLRAHLAADASLFDVAAAVGISPYHLSRMFRLHAGDTFVHVYARLRVDAAKTLLRSTRHSVKEICSLLGFNDQAYFSRVFRRFAGLSPGEYRAGGRESAK